MWGWLSRGSKVDVGRYNLCGWLCRDRALLRVSFGSSTNKSSRNLMIFLSEHSVPFSVVLISVNITQFGVKRSLLSCV